MSEWNNFSAIQLVRRDTSSFNSLKKKKINKEYGHCLNELLAEQQWVYLHVNVSPWQRNTGKFIKREQNRIFKIHLKKKSHLATGGFQQELLSSGGSSSGM